MTAIERLQTFADQRTGDPRLDAMKSAVAKDVVRLLLASERQADAKTERLAIESETY